MMTITPSREAVEAAARVISPGLNWENGHAPGPYKQRALTTAGEVLTAALPHLAPQPSASDEGRAERVHSAWGKDKTAWSNESLYRYYDAEFAAVRAKATLDGAAAEREACAKMIEDNTVLFCSSGPNELRPRMDGDRNGLDYAAAIRARS